MALDMVLQVGGFNPSIVPTQWHLYARPLRLHAAGIKRHWPDSKPLHWQHSWQPTQRYPVASPLQPEHLDQVSQHCKIPETVGMTDNDTNSRTITNRQAISLYGVNDPHSTLKYIVSLLDWSISLMTYVGRCQSTMLGLTATIMSTM